MRIRGWKEGVMAGCPDVLVMWPNEKYHGLALEFKVPGNGPSTEQTGFLDRLNAAGYLAVVVYGYAEALKAFCDYLDLDIVQST